MVEWRFGKLNEEKSLEGETESARKSVEYKVVNRKVKKIGHKNKKKANKDLRRVNENLKEKNKMFWKEVQSQTSQGLWKALRVDIR